jgi:nitrite reductase (NO-forming)
MLALAIAFLATAVVLAQDDRGPATPYVAEAASASSPVDAEALERTLQPDPVAPASSRAGSDGIVEFALTTTEVKARLSNDATYTFWTFDDTVPGPMLRVTEGDEVRIVLANAEDSTVPHSIDLHAVNGPGGGAVHTQTSPGEETSFEFTARNPGLYVYHCATPDVPTHVANGMYGMILVEPEGGLPVVDREFYVVQGEVYADGREGDLRFDGDRMDSEDATFIVMNGAVGSLTGEHALKARVGERVRIYYGVGGFVPSNFHVIGEIFDRVHAEGATEGQSNVQTTLIPAGGAAWAEFTVDEPGAYHLIDHALQRIHKGALATLEVE